MSVATKLSARVTDRASALIFSGGNDFQVVWIDTTLYTAQMVDVHPRWNFALVQFIAGAMGVPTAAADRIEISIPARIEKSSP
jgi:hypothetical protein